MNHSHDQLKKMTVLLVEDDPATLASLATFIKPRVKELYTASNGRDGLNLYDTRKPDMVMADMIMPVMDGIEMAIGIRAINPDAIIILITGLSNEYSLRRALELIPDAFIEKPINFKRLRGVMGQMAARIKASMQVRKERELKDLILNSLPLPTMLVSAASERVIFANQMAENLGIKRGDDLSGPFFSPEIVQDMKPYPEQECCEQSFGEEVYAFGKPWQVKITPVNKQIFLFTALDITWQKKLENLREDVDRMTRHDLKTPLNGIIGLPDILLHDSNLTDEQREIIEMIKKSALNMLDMINLSLDLFRMEQGNYEVEHQSVDIVKIVDSIKMQLKNSLDSKAMKIIIRKEGKQVENLDSFFVIGEYLLVYSMLANLIKNAIEASPENESIIVDMCRDKEYSVIIINNKGMVPEKLKHSFFEKYTTYGKVGGTGLGTYSSKLIARTLGGNITMTSSKERGTSIRVTLPGEKTFH